MGARKKDSTKTNLRRTIADDLLLHNIEITAKLEGSFLRELKTLPRGGVVFKRIKGKPYPYLQYYKDGIRIQKYIKTAEADVRVGQAKRRQQLAPALRQVRRFRKALLAEFPEYADFYAEAMHGVMSAIPHKPSVSVPATPSRKMERYKENRKFITANGEPVRSKIELIIANCLHMNNIEYYYEKEILLGGEPVTPDFTFIRPLTNTEIYWEHCGMMDDPDYRERWEWKRRLYAKHGIIEGKNLIVTYDNPEDGLNYNEIELIVQRYIM